MVLSCVYIQEWQDEEQTDEEFVVEEEEPEAKPRKQKKDKVP